MGGHNFIDLTNQVFGELKVVSYNPGTKHNRSTWTCKCSCGNTVKVPGYALRAGHYKSCGCKQVEKRSKGVKEHIKKDRVAGTRKSALIQKAHKDSSSGVKGVCWMASRQKWRAYIGFQGRQITLGYFKNKEDAIKARKEAEEKYHKPILEDEQHEENN